MGWLAVGGLLRSVGLVGLEAPAALAALAALVAPAALAGLVGVALGVSAAAGDFRFLTPPLKSPGSRRGLAVVSKSDGD